MKPHISIIIPTYNSATTLKRAVYSVLNQGYDFFEIIVIDDGSIDHTRDVVESFGDKIIYKYQNNKGPAAARNTGIFLSTGEFIAFLDADDVWLPEKINKQIDYMKKNLDIGLCFTDMMHFANNRKINHSYLHENGYKYLGSGWIYENLLRECFIFTPTVMLRRTVINQTGLFDETLKVAEDYDLWLRIADMFQMGYIDSPLVIRYRHDHNITSNLFLYLESNICHMESLEKKNHGKPQRIHIIRNRLADLHYDLAYNFYRRGKKTEAIRSCKLSIRYYFELKTLMLWIAAILPEKMVRIIKQMKGMRQ